MPILKFLVKRGRTYLDVTKFSLVSLCSNFVDIVASASTYPQVKFNC